MNVCCLIGQFRLFLFIDCGFFVDNILQLSVTTVNLLVYKCSESAVPQGLWVELCRYSCRRVSKVWERINNLLQEIIIFYSIIITKIFLIRQIEFWNRVQTTRFVISYLDRLNGGNFVLTSVGGATDKAILGPQYSQSSSETFRNWIIGISDIFLRIIGGRCSRPTSRTSRNSRTGGAPRASWTRNHMSAS